MAVKRKDVKRAISKLDDIKGISDEVLLFIRTNYYKMFSNENAEETSTSYNLEDYVLDKTRIGGLNESKLIKQFVLASKGKRYCHIINRLLKNDWKNIIDEIKNKNKLKAVVYLKHNIDKNFSLVDTKNFIDDFSLLFSK